MLACHNPPAPSLPPFMPALARRSLHTLSSHLGAGKVASGGFWGSGNGLMGQRGRRLLLRLQICRSVCVCVWQRRGRREGGRKCAPFWHWVRLLGGSSSSSRRRRGGELKRLKTCHSRKTSKKHTLAGTCTPHTHTLAYTCQYTHFLPLSRSPSHTHTVTHAQAATECEMHSGGL